MKKGLKFQNLLSEVAIAVIFVALLNSCKDKGGAEPQATTPTVTASVPGAWQDVQVANFDNSSELSNWDAANRFDYNSSQCMYVPGANSIQTLDGKSCLCITARKIRDGYYESGNIQTKTSFQPKANEEYHFTASIKLIAQDATGAYKGFAQTYGGWPAFWTVQHTAWPTKGEIDIMEAYSYYGVKSTRMASNLFYGTVQNQNILNNQLERAMVYTEDWHTYEMFWKNVAGKVTVTVKLDGMTTATYTNETFGAGLQLENFGGHVMVLNLNVGSTNSIFDNSKINLFDKTMMFVDYAKVEKRTL